MFRAIPKSSQHLKCLRALHNRGTASFSSRPTNLLCTKTGEHQSFVPELRHNLASTCTKYRCYSTSNESSEPETSTERKLPRFSDEPVEAGIHIAATIKSAFFTFLIRGRYDPQFTKREFVRGSNQAIEVSLLHFESYWKVKSLNVGVPLTGDIPKAG